jgi:hypothetical protein
MGFVDGLVMGGGDYFWLNSTLLIKIIKLKFYEIKKKLKLVPTDRFQFGLAQLFYIKNQNPTNQFWFGLVWFGSV